MENKELEKDVVDNTEVVNDQPVKEEDSKVEATKVETAPATKEKKAKKNKEEEKENWFLKVLKEEHKWETYLLGLSSCLAIGLGVLILTGGLQIKPGTPVLSDYTTLVGWVFTGFGVFGFLLFIIPIFKPTKKELKQLSLPSKKLFLGNIARVFIFITILALIFVLYESVISAILGKLV